MRALEPRVTGKAVNPCDGVGVAFEVFGPVDAERTVVFAPAGLFAHGRLWKMQVPFFALLGYRVVTYDARGSGSSDRPDEDYTPQRFQEDLLQSEIAEAVGCSQMHVSRIIRSSLEKLYAYGSGMKVEA